MGSRATDEQIKQLRELTSGRYDDRALAFAIEFEENNVADAYTTILSSTSARFFVGFFGAGQGVTSTEPAAKPAGWQRGGWVKDEPGPGAAPAARAGLAPLALVSKADALSPMKSKGANRRLLISVLGGPGSGKGTACARLASRCGLAP